MSEIIAPGNLTLKPATCERYKKTCKEKGGLADFSRFVHVRTGETITTESLAKYLRGKNGKRRKILAICKAFEEDWWEVCIEGEEIDKIPASISSTTDTNDIDHIVRDICKKVRLLPPPRLKCPKGKKPKQWVKETFIELKLMEANGPLTDFFYVDEYYDGLTSSFFDSEECTGPARRRQPQGKRITIQSALEDHDRLFIYGEPGSGKTNSLFWIAAKCSDQELLAGYIPVFIDFGDFPGTEEKTLSKVIEGMFEKWGYPTEKYEYILDTGRIVFIFDGIDETPAEKQDLMLIQIRRLLGVNTHCKFILSSRLGADFSSLRGFHKFLISALKHEQIEEFINKWFATNGGYTSQASSMFRQLHDDYHQDVLELAQRPILLELLCRIFQKSQQNNLPTNRFATFRDGISIMRRPSLQFKHKMPGLSSLSPHTVLNILREIAQYFFLKRDFKVFFRTHQVEHVIGAYIASKFDIKKSDISSIDIIKSIEQYNGLLVEWAGNRCAFSHLTYQEYFVADYLLHEDREQDIYQYIDKHHWRFVIRLISEGIPFERAWDFFVGFKQTIDSHIITDPKLKAFTEDIEHLAQVKAQEIGLKLAYPEVNLRAWYFSSILQNSGRIDSLSFRNKMFSLPTIEHANNLIEDDALRAHELVYKLYHAFNQQDITAQWVRTQLTALQRELQKQDIDTRPTKGVVGKLNTQRAKFDNDIAWWMAKQGLWQQSIQGTIETLNLPSIIGMEEAQIKRLKVYYKTSRLLSICLNQSQLIGGDDIKVTKIRNALLSIGNQLS